MASLYGKLDISSLIKQNLSIHKKVLGVVVDGWAFVQEPSSPKRASCSELGLLSSINLLVGVWGPTQQ
jgi:hypothetical protein